MINAGRLLLVLFIPFLFLGAGNDSTNTAPTFSRDVWPILQKHCLTCHQPGEIGPMAFASYKQVRPWAAAIKEAVQTRAMPPWHAAPGDHPFRNDRSLSKLERETLVAWTNEGAPEGAPLPAYQAAARKAGWKLGDPDIIVEIPGFAVPKTGLLSYSFLIVPLHLDRDTWVRAAEFQIDQRAVIHHINAFVRTPSSSYLAGFPQNQIFVPTVAERGKRREGEKVFDRRELLLGYEPGYDPHPWLEDGAELIKAGSDIVLEMHYSPNGKEAVDHSKLALYFAKTAPAKRILAIDTLRDLDLRLLPNEANYVSHAGMTLAAPARLLSVQPHMHMRGKSMEVSAVFPGGRTDMLVSVPRYDFNWQTTYTFSDPIPLPAGTRLESVAHFDNSSNNRFNPDASATIHWGDQTTDEMHIAFLELVIDAKANAESLFVEAPRMIAPSAPHKIGEEHAKERRLADGEEFTMAAKQLVDWGRRVFEANWTEQDGAGRPLSKGNGQPLSDPTSPLVGRRAFNRVSGPDANSCNGCHNAPYGIPGGSADFAAGTFVLGQRFDFVTFDHEDAVPLRGAVDAE